MSRGPVTVTLTGREASLLLANEWNDHPSWSDIAQKTRSARRDRSAGGDAQEHAMELPADPVARNNHRAMWADVALRAFAELTGRDVEADGVDTAISDLLADLHHLAGRHDVSWSAVPGRADGHYTEETTHDSRMRDLAMRAMHRIPHRRPRHRGRRDGRHPRRMRRRVEAGQRPGLRVVGIPMVAVPIGEGDENDEQDTSCHCGHPECGAC
jgi:hypothetical protein